MIVRWLAVGFVFDADSLDSCVPENDIFHPFAFVVFALVMEGHRDVICVDILARDTPKKISKKIVYFKKNSKLDLNNPIIQHKIIEQQSILWISHWSIFQEIYKKWQTFVILHFSFAIDLKMLWKGNMKLVVSTQSNISSQEDLQNKSSVQHKRLKDIFPWNSCRCIQSFIL